MPNCTIILHRHSGVERVGKKPTSFVADRLRPMIEGKMTNGSVLHVIHDRVPCHPLSPELMDQFEEAAKSRKVRRVWTKYDREWREGAKKAFAKADEGEESIMLTRALCPDAALILETNMRKRRAIVNHVGFYPLEAAIEYTLCRIEQQRSRQCAGKQDLKGAVEHLMRAHEALASCNLLRDMDLFRQIKHLGVDVVVLRSMNHVYLGDLADHSIPIVPDSHSVMEFHEYVERNGVKIIPVAEETPLSFGEQAMNTICSGGIDHDVHKRLALQEMMFLSFLTKCDGWDDPEMWKAGYLITERDYDNIRRQIYG